MDLIERGNHAVEARLLAGANVSARVRDQVGKPEPLGPFQFHDERFQRTAIEKFVGRGEIDQVRIVGQEVLHARLPQRFFEERDLLVSDFPGPPLVGVLGKELHRSQSWPWAASSARW
jgi:hypothetical protein